MDYESNRTGNPIEGNRRPTDRLCSFIFSIIVIVWLAIVIAGFSAHRNYNSSDRNITLDQMPTVKPVVVAHRPTVRLILSVLMSTAGGFLYIFLTEKKPGAFLNIGLVFYSLFTILLSIVVVFAVIEFVSQIDVISVVILIVILLIEIETITCCISLFKADTNILCDIIKDSCRTILRSPLIVFLSFLAAMLMALVNLFTLHALAFDVFSDHSKILLVFYDIVKSGGTYMLFFILYFAVMVVSEYTINYYWEKNEKASYRVGRSIVDSFRNIGTIMFAAIISISYVYQIIQAFKHKRSRNNKENWIFYVVCKVYLALMPISINPLIFSSIYGTDFVNSVRKTFDVVLSRSSFFLATQAMFMAVFLVTPIFTWLVGLVISTAIVSVGDSDTDDNENTSLIFKATLLPLMFILALTGIATKALSINQIIILSREDQ